MACVFCSFVDKLCPLVIPKLEVQHLSRVLLWVGVQAGWGPLNRQMLSLAGPT